MPEYANGGLLPKQEQDDAIPAWVSTGCTYMAHAPRRNHDLLKAINELSHE